MPEQSHGEGRYSCLKRPVVAILVGKSGFVYIGYNDIAYPTDVCPREKRGMLHGEGWELCYEICGQRHHAEIDALSCAGKDGQGGMMYLIGHEVACQNCMAALSENGVNLIIWASTYSDGVLSNLLDELKGLQRPDVRS